MTPRLGEAAIEVALGVLVLLYGLGVIKASKNPQANAAYLKKYRWVLVAGGIGIIVLAVTRALSPMP